MWRVQCLCVWCPTAKVDILQVKFLRLLRNLFHAPSRNLKKERRRKRFTVPLIAKYSFDILLGRDFQGTAIASCHKIRPFQMP